MKRPLKPDDFNHITDLFQAEAFRFEARASYLVEAERESLESFINGEPAMISHKMFQDWLESLRRLRDSHRKIQRVRVVAEPPTVYQCWGAWHGEFNESEGEIIRYISRSRAIGLGLPVDGGDWWLFDDERVARMYFDGENKPLGGYIDTDLLRVQTCIKWRDLAMANAVRRDEYPDPKLTASPGSGEPG
jgi:hypothetical protein